MKKTDDETLVKAMRRIAHDMVSYDGIAQAAILEAAERMEKQSHALRQIAIECDPRGRQPVDKKKVFDLAFESVVRSK
jgi:hypothetical protein